MMKVQKWNNRSATNMLTDISQKAIQTAVTVSFRLNEIICWLWNFPSDPLIFNSTASCSENQVPQVFPVHNIAT